MLAKLKSGWVSILKQCNINLLCFFKQGEIFGTLNLSKIEMVPVGWNITKKQKIIFVFGLESLNFIIERIIFSGQNYYNVIVWPVDKLNQASRQKKNGRMLSWNLSKVSIICKLSILAKP